jgi:tRNA U34 5-carboxymethylaminomethyl modifying enzyme MnmG/GidA
MRVTSLAEHSARILCWCIHTHTSSAYLKQQEAEIAAFKKEESLTLPADLDYSEMASLSTEERQKLDAARPTTLGKDLFTFCMADAMMQLRL